MPLLFLILLLGVMPKALAAESPEAFFSRYIALSDRLDPAIGELYADNALVETYRIYAHGAEKAVEISGSQWKKLLKKMLPGVDGGLNVNRFSDVRIERQPESIKIRAVRYSTAKCYMDSGYYMVVAPDHLGQLKIIEEHRETKAQSNCPGSSS